EGPVEPAQVRGDPGQAPARLAVLRVLEGVDEADGAVPRERARRFEIEAARIDALEVAEEGRRRAHRGEALDRGRDRVPEPRAISGGGDAQARAPEEHGRVEAVAAHEVEARVRPVGGRAVEELQEARRAHAAAVAGLEREVAREAIDRGQAGLDASPQVVEMVEAEPARDA